MRLLSCLQGCLDRLTAEFPGSPRVQCLEGILKETKESPEAALRFYERLLEEDPSNAVCCSPLSFHFYFTEKAVEGDMEATNLCA